MRNQRKTRNALAGLLGLVALAANVSAQAMDWTAQTTMRIGEVIYAGKGDVVADDAERLQALIAASLGADGRPGRFEQNFNNSHRQQVSLNSDGGNVVGGLRLGDFIRSQGFGTVVAAGADCHSACTMAFLGGVTRLVAGRLGIHAMSVKRTTSDTLDAVQSLSSVFFRYTREMTGTDDMAAAALKFGSGGIKLVSDLELRDWNIITVASRPQQSYRGGDFSTIDCVNPADASIVQKIACSDLALARADIRITRALNALRARPSAQSIEADQARWKAYRDGCGKWRRRAMEFRLPSQGASPSSGESEFIRQALEAARVPGYTYGETSVESCLREAFELRLRELEALAEYEGIRGGRVAAEGWHSPAK